MTRINLVPVHTLTDQHLIAEYRELPRVFALARRDANIPKNFVLGKGHVTFFYDKLKFLERRLRLLIEECQRRGFKISNIEIDFKCDPTLYNDYIPRVKDVKLSKERIREKLAAKPNWYKYRGKLVDD